MANGENITDLSGMPPNVPLCQCRQCGKEKYGYLHWFELILHEYGARSLFFCSQKCLTKYLNSVALEE